LALVETVIKFHPDFNNCHDEDGLLPIHLAMKKNNISIIKSLIQHGADANAQAEEGWLSVSIYFSKILLFYSKLKQ